MTQLLFVAHGIPRWVSTLVLQIIHDFTEATWVFILQLLHDIVQTEAGGVQVALHLGNLILIRALQLTQVLDSLICRFGVLG